MNIKEPSPEIHHLSDEVQDLIPLLDIGDPAAIEVLDLLYVGGDLTDADIKYFRESFKKLISRGGTMGFLAMGSSYAYGDIKDLKLSAWYYKRAAEKGDPVGMRMYGSYLFTEANKVIIGYEKKSIFLRLVSFLTGARKRVFEEVGSMVEDAFIMAKAAAILNDPIATKSINVLEHNFFKNLSQDEVDLYQNKVTKFLATIK